MPDVPPSATAGLGFRPRAGAEKYGWVPRRAGPRVYAHSAQRLGGDDRQTALDRLRILVDAGIALSSELSLDALLQQLVEKAALLTGARYAALGVIDQTGTALERFLTTGIDAETHAAIGDLPEGTRDPRRAHPGGRAAPASEPRRRPAVGRIPANHPPMQTFLGVPDPPSRSGVRESLPHREAGRRRVHRRGRGARPTARSTGRGRDREHAAVRDVDALATPPRVVERDRRSARRRARAGAPSRPRRAPPA